MRSLAVVLLGALAGICGGGALIRVGETFARENCPPFGYCLVLVVTALVGVGLAYEAFERKSK